MSPTLMAVARAASSTTASATSATASASATSATASASATSSSASATLAVSSNLKIVGIVLAVASGLLIGSSFVFKKKGLLRSQGAGELGEGVAYLKSPLWWIGMSMMILGELCNFAAYAFVEALVVTPLGALSVVICAILSSIFLKEKLNFFGWLGCGLCILGSIIIALNGPQEPTIGKITVFEKLFLSPGFLSYASVLIVAALVIIFYFAPRYGKKNMLWYLFVCSMIGGISVSVTTGLGAAIVETARGDNQFKFWFIYFLFGFIAVTLVVEVYYLNVALALFNTAMVTPTYYVIFTFFSILTSIILFQGLHASVVQILTLVMGFLVICFGITILQLSKVDPEHLNKLDRRSTLLLQAARTQAGHVDEKSDLSLEDPGIDSLRGSFGTVGSIIRARTRKRMSQNSQNTTRVRMRSSSSAAPHDPTSTMLGTYPHADLPRHQLYDPPVPLDDAASIQEPVISNKEPTIQFDSRDVVHSYQRPGTGDNIAMHEHRQAQGSTVRDAYPPLSTNVPVTSPTMSRGSTDPPVPRIPPPREGQLVNIPPFLSNEHTVHSAPAVFQGRYTPLDTAEPTTLKDSISGKETLLSFDSVTDSAPSDWGTPGEAKQENARKGKLRERAKRYPGGSGDDNEEEQVTLFSKDRISSDEDHRRESVSSSPVDVFGSVRLVSNQREYF